MRWDHLAENPATARDAALFGADLVTSRTFDTPEFRGMTFHEVRARTIVNRVPGASRMPFEWTVNPYRGCTHACVYCFARKTHSYLDLDTGLDFDSQIVVKVNAPDLLRRQLASPRWHGEHIAMGTNVDCYQRAEGRYRLMPGIIAALRDHANPFSILTKGTLILRDLELIRQAAEVTEVGVSVSVGFTDPELWRTVEPGTPAPERRLDVVRAFTDLGIGCGVLMAPVLPFLSDHPDRLRATVRAIAASGATSVTPLVLHLRPGAREWYMAWLERHHPRLVRRYELLYAEGAYAPKWYQRQITRQVHELAEEYGMGPRRAELPRRTPAREPAAPEPVRGTEPTQLTLL
ncbi:Rv2578c family radical SAM protein [Streptomyces caniscabiei]|uniref:Rv2578c family radical SAM protein n=1 Tax=Streptomyces caniscabiei TaxID=2746961 RepID=A0A927KY32_9ACTN|nr:Rv2578c family radical SAM protein [Streptomyces caniscabiei]MBD9721822.1 Rv2578c family radical SAM protein [Streptomyces caniscabiei]MDX2603654.1 Rv2578c family radical SAM protein [Streptomyces caniscabiei]MDX2738814.1 Rv2578c family radical SAM protein [Streptomyces caniscabiei]MDX2781635.1 Rv2578c family radical SAM protein [Streptomyces caniscabiei]MDX3509013.1 Rv2578c family radical SAM protein [Streptomyces caniscabiei]